MIHYKSVHLGVDTPGVIFRAFDSNGATISRIQKLLSTVTKMEDVKALLEKVLTHVGKLSNRVDNIETKQKDFYAALGASMFVPYV